MSSAPFVEQMGEVSLLVAEIAGKDNYGNGCWSSYCHL
jgi:hypothetical protein